MQPGDYEAVSQSTTREEFRAALLGFAARLDFPLVNALLVDGEIDSPNLKIGAIGNTPKSFCLGSSRMSLASRRRRRSVTGGLTSRSLPSSRTMRVPFWS
jgi:hypothetical protein